MQKNFSILKKGNRDRQTNQQLYMFLKKLLKQVKIKKALKLDRDIPKDTNRWSK